MAGVSEDADCVQAIARYPDAAAKVLGEQGKPLNCQQMIDAMAAKGYWTSPGGQTPSATLYSAILRELKTKKSEARFRKTERGKFELRSNARGHRPHLTQSGFPG